METKTNKHGITFHEITDETAITGRIVFRKERKGVYIVQTEANGQQPFRATNLKEAEYKATQIFNNNRLEN